MLFEFQAEAEEREERKRMQELREQERRQEEERDRLQEQKQVRNSVLSPAISSNLLCPYEKMLRICACVFRRRWSVGPKRSRRGRRRRST